MATSIDQEIADEVRGLDLPALRRRYLELYGEESRGGAQYLRTKIAYALLQQRMRERAEPLEDEPGTGSHMNGDGGQVGDVAAQAEELEQRGENAEAADLFTRAASLAVGNPQLAAELRGRAKACNDRQDAKADTALDEWAAEGLQKTIERAQSYERLGQLSAAARAWAAASMLERDRAIAGGYLERGRGLEAARRAMPSAVTMRGKKLTVGELEDAGEVVGDVIAAALRRRLEAPRPPLVEEPHSQPLAELLAPAASASVPTIEETKQEVAERDVKPQKTPREPAIVNNADHATRLSATIAAIQGRKPRDPRLPPPGTSWHPVNAPPGLLVVFADEDLAVVESPERPEFIGERFATVSSLARAYNGRNTNGYQWFGLRKPWAEAVTTPVALEVCDPVEEAKAAGDVLTAELNRSIEKLGEEIDRLPDPPRGQSAVETMEVPAVQLGDTVRMWDGRMGRVVEMPRGKFDGLPRNADGSLVEEPGTGRTPPAPAGWVDPTGRGGGLEDVTHDELVRVVRTLKRELEEAHADHENDRVVWARTLFEEARDRAQAQCPNPKLWQVYNHAQAIAAERVAQVYAELAEALRTDRSYP